MKNCIKKITSSFVFVTFLFVALFSGCKFSSLNTNPKTSIVINLPYGNSARAASDPSYNFQIDCYSGDAVGGTAVFAKSASSGDTVSFEDVEPGTYTVNVKAYEQSNPGVVIYEGSDTQEVTAGNTTTFAIKMAKYLQNYCWLRFSESEDFIPAVQMKDGVSVVEHYWYYNGVDVSSLITDDVLNIENFFASIESSTNAAIAEMVANNFPIEGEVNIGQLTLVTKFSDGSYDSFIINNFTQNFMAELLEEDILRAGQIDEDYYFEGLFKDTKFSTDNGLKLTRYLKNNTAGTSNFSYNFTFVPVTGMTAPTSAKIEFFDITDTSLSSAKKTITSSTATTISGNALNYNFATTLDAGYYLIKITVPQLQYTVQSSSTSSGTYIYSFQDLIRIDSGYQTYVMITENLNIVSMSGEKTGGNLRESPYILTIPSLTFPKETNGDTFDDGSSSNCYEKVMALWDYDEQDLSYSKGDFFKITISGTPDTDISDIYFQIMYLDEAADWNCTQLPQHGFLCCYNLSENVPFEQNYIFESTCSGNIRRTQIIMQYNDRYDYSWAGYTPEWLDKELTIKNFKIKIEAIDNPLTWEIKTEKGLKPLTSGTSDGGYAENSDIKVMYIHCTENVTPMFGDSESNYTTAPWKDEDINAVVFDDNIEAIGDKFFYRTTAGSNVAKITLPKNIKYIGNAAFFTNCIKEITIPSSVTYMGHQAMGIWTPQNLILGWSQTDTTRRTLSFIEKTRTNCGYSYSGSGTGSSSSGTGSGETE